MESDPNGPLAGTSRWVLGAVLAGLMAVVFLADAMTPLGVAVWLYYVPLCAAAAWFGRFRTSIAAGIVASVLIIAGFYASPPGLDTWLAAQNRVFVLIAVWLVIGIITPLRKSARISQGNNTQLTRDLNARLSAILDNADDAIISVDRDQNITLFNRGAEKIFGYAAGDVIGRSLNLLLPAKTAGAHATLVNEFGRSPVQARRMAERGAVAGRRKDGTEFPAEVSISKTELRTGITYTAILRDVSERVHADALFREREQRLRVALSAGHMGVFQVDQVASIIRQDEVAAALLGMERTRTESTVDGFFEQVRPEDRAAVREEILRMRREGGDFAMEFRVPIPGDGDRWIAARGFCELDTQGKAIRATGVLYDVTERMTSTALLREREQRLKLALEAGQMGTFQNDEARGTVDLDAVTRKLLEWPPGETRADALFDRIHPDDKPMAMARFERARNEGGSDTFEFRVRLSDGSYRWIQSHGRLELDATGRPFRSVGIIRDITERKNVEQALEARVAERTAELRHEIARREEAQTALIRSQKLQAVGELAGGMAHDFNNLLTVITGNLELLGFRQLDDKARDHVRRADEAAKMGARLTGRLLAIGRRQRLQAVALDLNEAARSMSDVLKRTLGDEIVLETSFADDLWPALADVSEVENAVLNLAVNARDAMPHGGRLVVKTENKSLGPDDVAGEAGLKPGAYVLLSVSDTGTGMPPDVLARAFEPYFTTKQMGRGTGLGLSTIYGFAKQLGGHVTIYSEPGKGTSVRLYLPRATGAADAGRDTGAAPTLPGAEGETILVVEDNADVRDVTVKRLDMLGYRVLAAEHAPRAMEILKAEPNIALVFSDVMMPGGMSGFDLAHWIRTNRPEVKILLTSGFTGEVARNGETPAADIEVLRKPYATADLARAVRETLSSE